MLSNKRLSRRQFLAGSLTLIGGAALTACAPTMPAADGQAGDSPSEEATTLLFHSRLGSHADWHKSRVSLFEEQNPDLKLEIDELPGNEMYPKVYAMSASGTVGDVVWTYLNNPPEHKAKGVMIPLDDIIASKGYDTSPFWKSLLDALTLEGQLHAIPNHGHYGTVTYYFNRQLYEEAGVDMPHTDWTVDELVEGAKAITDAPEVWGFRSVGRGQEHIPSYLRMFGGDLLNPEGTQCLIAEEKSVEALRWLYDLQYTHEVDPCNCGTDTRNNFVAGKVGGYNWTTGFVAQFSALPESDWPFEWDATIGPVGPYGDRGSQVSAAAFCITENSDHPAEAFQILDFYSTLEDGIEHVYNGAGSPGGRTDVWESERLNALHPIYKITAEKYPDGPQPWYRPANARTSEFIDTMNNNLEAIFTNNVGFEEGIELTRQLCQEVLDKEPLL